MLSKFLRIFLFAGVLALFGSVPGKADEQIGAFLVVDGVDDVIAMTGEITLNSPLDFRRALQRRPDVTTLVVASPGGLVTSALIIAQDVHQRGLGTYIPTELGCYSACAYVFLAGADRVADGELGVHQMAADVPDSAGMQTTISDLLDTLREFDTPQEVISRMLRTPNETMYVFTKHEVEVLGINRVAALKDDNQKSVPVVETSKVPAGPIAEPESVTRLAIYEGLDFFGEDLSLGHQENVVECSRACLGDSACKAFTFNANPKIKTGPNCFLKSEVGRLEGYEEAISGLVLAPSEGAAPEFTFGAIDPTRDVVSGKRYQGGDLGGATAGQIDTLGNCRMACVDDNLCRGFSYRAATKQCWLKSSLGAASPAKGYSIGTKRFVSISATSVIPVEE